MLVIGRFDGQGVWITHAASGDRMFVRLYQIHGGSEDVRPSGRLAFEDEAHLFKIDRPERVSRPRSDQNHVPQD